MNVCTKPNMKRNVSFCEKNDVNEFVAGECGEWRQLMAEVEIIGMGYYVRGELG